MTWFYCALTEGHPNEVPLHPSTEVIPAADESYCPKCGHYMPLTLDGTRRVHQCGSTQ